MVRELAEICLATMKNVENVFERNIFMYWTFWLRKSLVDHQNTGSRKDYVGIFELMILPSGNYVVNKGFRPGLLVPFQAHFGTKTVYCLTIIFMWLWVISTFLSCGDLAEILTKKLDDNSWNSRGLPVGLISSSRQLKHPSDSGLKCYDPI